MNPQLMALLAQAGSSGGAQSQGGSPVAAMIQKLMGSGGSAPMPQQAQGQAPLPYDQTQEDQQAGRLQPLQNGPGPAANGRQMLEDRIRGRGEPEGDGSEPQTTEEELEMARKGMGVRDKQGNVPTPQPNRLRQMQDNPSRENHLPYEGTRRSGPTSRDKAIMDEIPTDDVLETAEKRFGLRGMSRR